MNKRKCIKKFPFAIKFKLPLKDLFTKYEMKFNESLITTLDIDPDEKMETLSFMDEARKVHKCMLSKIDFQNSQDYCCFWDRYPLGNQSINSIGCPIVHVPNVISRTYFSEITKEKFMVKESVTTNQIISPDIYVKLEPNDFYETDGIFCSFNCCLAFIRENKHNILYKNSELLLFRIHNDFFGNTKVYPAPSWRILKMFGGTVDIVSFRQNFSKVDYEGKGIYKPHFKSIAHAFEEKIKF